MYVHRIRSTLVGKGWAIAARKKPELDSIHKGLQFELIITDFNFSIQLSALVLCFFKMFRGGLLKDMRSCPVKSGLQRHEEKHNRNPTCIVGDILATGCPRNSGCLGTPSTSASDATKENIMLSTYRNITIEYSPKKDGLQPGVIFDNCSQTCQIDLESVPLHTSRETVPNMTGSAQYLESSTHSRIGWMAEPYVIPESCVMDAGSDWPLHKQNASLWRLAHQKDISDSTQYNAAPEIAEVSHPHDSRLSISGHGLYESVGIKETAPDSQGKWILPSYEERSISYENFREESEVQHSIHTGKIGDKGFFGIIHPSTVSDLVHQERSVLPTTSDIPTSTSPYPKCEEGYTVREVTKFEDGMVDTIATGMGCGNLEGHGKDQEVNLNQHVSNYTHNSVCSTIKLGSTAGMPSSVPLTSFHEHESASLGEINERCDLPKNLSSAGHRKLHTPQVKHTPDSPLDGVCHPEKGLLVDRFSRRGEFKISHMVNEMVEKCMREKQGVLCNPWSPRGPGKCTEKGVHQIALHKLQTHAGSSKLEPAAPDPQMGTTTSKARRKTRTPSRLAPACDSSAMERLHPVQLHCDTNVDRKCNRPAGPNKSRITAGMCKSYPQGKSRCNQDKEIGNIETVMQDSSCKLQRLDPHHAQNTESSAGNDSTIDVHMNPVRLETIQRETNNGRSTQSKDSSTTPGLHSSKCIMGMGDGNEGIKTSMRKRQCIDSEYQLNVERTKPRKTSRSCRKMRKPQRLIEQPMDTNQAISIQKKIEEDCSIRATSGEAEYEDGDNLSAVSSMLGYSLNPDGSVSGPPPLGVGAKYHRMILPATFTSQSSVRALGKGSKMVLEIGNSGGVCQDAPQKWRKEQAHPQSKSTSFNGLQRTTIACGLESVTAKSNGVNTQVHISTGCLELRFRDSR